MLMLDGSSLGGVVATFQLNLALYHSMTEGSTSVHHGNDVGRPPSFAAEAWILC